MSTVTHTFEEVDAAARYLRETMQSGKRLTPWEVTPNATKRKWILLASGALDAAAKAKPGSHS